MFTKQLDEDNDGSVSLIDLENFSKIHNINGSIDSAKFLIEEANARGMYENSFLSSHFLDAVVIFFTLSDSHCGTSRKA